jgi:predicted DNA-binding transcriptional regulator AlpA
MTTSTAVPLTIEPLAVDKETAAAMLGGMSVSTLETLGRTEELLQPVELSSRRVGYPVENLRAWLRTRPKSAQLPPKDCHIGRGGRTGTAAGSTVMPGPSVSGQ